MKLIKLFVTYLVLGFFWGIIYKSAQKPLAFVGTLV